MIERVVGSRDWLPRSALLVGLAAIALLLLPRPVQAFGESGVFNPRLLIAGTARLDGPRTNAPRHWSWELTRRTSAPARLAPDSTRADSANLLAEPFAWWLGDKDPGELSPREVAMLRQFFALGGTLLVDDSEPDKGEFKRGARRELGRVIPDIAPIALGPEHVIFRTFYLLRRAEGRVAGPPKLEALVRNATAQVIFTQHDLAGAVAQNPGGAPAYVATPGGERQRERATRLLVNLAMYVLCTNYKDDQVHAPFLMRRRARDF